MRLKPIVITVAVVAVAFAVSLKAMDWRTPSQPPPTLAKLPPLPEATRSSTLLVPIQIPLKAIGEAAERAAPRNFAGKAANPVPQLLQDADITWTAARGAISASGVQNALALATPLAGKLNVTGSLSANARGALNEALGSLLGGNVAKQIGAINIKSFKGRRRNSRHRWHDIATGADGQLAHRAEPRGASRSRRHQPFDRRRPCQCAGANKTSHRSGRERTTRRPAAAHPQRSAARTERAP
jgi:hypothetical protein